MSEIRETVDRLTKWVRNKEMVGRFYQPVYNNPRELKDDVRLLLMEFEYKEFEDKA